jgi:tricarboxylate carrier
MINEANVGDLQQFNIHKPQYDQSSYWGRVRTLMSSQNPLHFYLPHSTIVAAKLLVEEEREKSSSNILSYYNTEKVNEIRHAESIVASSVHPDTGEIIPKPMRLCSYASMSIPVQFGLLLSKSTVFNIVFWQWTNQTYSAGVNYANRNASSSLDMKGIITAYGAACTASVGIGLGMRQLLSPISKNMKGPSKLFINFLVSLTAVGSAGFLNLLIMRSKEMQEGINLVDHEGVERGKSRIIGRKAVISTASTRLLMPIPPLLLPTITFYIMEKRNLVPKNRYVKGALDAAIFFLYLSLGPPLACSVFEQTARTKVDSIESEFHNLKDSNGDLVTELFYNKGL